MLVGIYKRKHHRQLAPTFHQVCGAHAASTQKAGNRMKGYRAKDVFFP